MTYIHKVYQLDFPCSGDYVKYGVIYCIALNKEKWN